MKADFYEGPLWKERLKAELMPMLEHYEFVVVDGPAAQFAGQFGCGK